MLKDKNTAGGIQKSLNAQIMFGFKMASTQSLQQQIFHGLQTWDEDSS